MTHSCVRHNSLLCAPSLTLVCVADSNLKACVRDISATHCCTHCCSATPQHTATATTKERKAVNFNMPHVATKAVVLQWCCSGVAVVLQCAQSCTARQIVNVCFCVYKHMYVCTCVYKHMYVCTVMYSKTDSKLERAPHTNFMHTPCQHRHRFC